MNKVSTIINVCEDLIFSKSKAIFDQKSGFELTRKVYDQNKYMVDHFVKEAEFMDQASYVPNQFRFELDGDLYYFSRANQLKEKLIIG